MIYYYYYGYLKHMVMNKRDPFYFFQIYYHQFANFTFNSELFFQNLSLIFQYFYLIINLLLYSNPPSLIPPRIFMII